jgi:hypothetical protein
VYANFLELRLAELPRKPLGNCPKRGSGDAPGVYLARVWGPKRAERADLGALWGRVSGTFGTFRTVSRRSSENASYETVWKLRIGSITRSHECAERDKRAPFRTLRATNKRAIRPAQRLSRQSLSELGDGRPISGTRPIRLAASSCTTTRCGPLPRISVNNGIKNDPSRGWPKLRLGSFFMLVLFVASTNADGGPGRLVGVVASCSSC